MMLYKLLSKMDQKTFQAEVISLTGLGPVADKISSLGIPVHDLGMTRGRPHPLLLWKLARQLRDMSPDLVQTWLYHSDLIGGLAAKMAGGIPTSWSIRQSNIDSDSNKRSTLITAKICAILSAWLPVKIICCSHAALESHVTLGYSRNRMVVIPNGFDLDKFRPDTDARLSVRDELNLSHNTPLVGLVARFDPQKDHKNFIDAAGIVNANHPSADYILCGADITPQNELLMSWINHHGLAKHFHLLGNRDDMPRLISAMDVAVSSSLGEGFPNVVGEAMACAVPCVVTDVGDSARIVGDTGRIVPPRNQTALAHAIHELLQMPQESRMVLGRLSRQRVEQNYSLGSVVRQYENAFRDAA